ncbi:MAG: CCA tRNA nucleotidyltransferase [Vallitalea sp.]|jgi:tRNA nucleotidyltransferase (CCA-adding enzyme)|nr:CCA tRNA nucleotidyltransferase [Vallitalea sp.]
MSDIKIKIPNYAKYIIDKLSENGYEAYVVGGCVRDSLIGKTPNDWDITTSALPQQVKKIFTKTIDTGLKHGTVTILVDKEPIEVTTYRIDGEYEDNRRPRTVEFTRNLIEDLKRRDFTINAMAYNDKDGLIDAFNGLEDLKKRVIKCVGKPWERFNEDALRMLRAIRFSAQLGYDIDDETNNAIKECSALIQNVSMERIQIELSKTLISQEPGKFMKIYECELMEYILPEFITCIGNSQNHPYHSYDIHEHLIKSVEAIKPDRALRWTMLLHDIGKPETKTTDEEGIDHFYGHIELSAMMASNILKRLKFDNKTINKVVRLIKVHDYRINNSPKTIRKAIKKIGDDLFLDYLSVQRADIMAQNINKMDSRLQMLDSIRNQYDEIKALSQCVSIKELKVNGKDLIENGIKEGKQIGYILNELLDVVIIDPDKNQKETLLQIANDIVKTRSKDL